MSEPTGQTSPDVHLATDDLQHDLAGRSARGGAVMIGSYAAQLVLGFGSLVVMTRLLTPHEFGVYAMAAAVVGFVATFRDFGLPMAIVQQPHLDQRRTSALFWLNAKLNVLLSFALAMTAPLAARYFREPVLTGALLVLTGGIFASGFALPLAGVMRRRMRFGAVTVVEVGAVAAGAVVGIVAALLRLGVWALVWQQVVVHLVQAAGTWLLCGWRPNRSEGIASDTSDEESLRAMKSYGGNLTAARIIAYVGETLDQVLVGRYFAARALGLYQKAEQWSALPFQQVYVPLLSVVIASFSRLQDDAERYRASARQTLRLVYAVTFPAAAFALVDAEKLIRLLMGEQWLDAVPIFRVLSVAGLCGSALLVSRWIFQAEGRTAAQWRWTMLTTPVLIGGVVIGRAHGPLGIAIGYAAALAVLALPTLWFCTRGSPLHLRDLTMPMIRPTLAAGVAAMVVWWCVRDRVPLKLSVVSRLLIDGVAFGLFYAGAWAVDRRGRAEAAQIGAMVRRIGTRTGNDAEAPSKLAG